MPQPVRLVVLASGTGTTLQALIDASDLGGEIVAVGADRPGITALERAAAAGIATFVVPFDGYPDRADWNRAFQAALAAHSPDLVVLAGFLRIFDPQLVRAFRIVNTHPVAVAVIPRRRRARGPRRAGPRGETVRGDGALGQRGASTPGRFWLR